MKINMDSNQYLASIKEIIDTRAEIFSKSNSIENKTKIPASFPLIDNTWYKIPDVICVFVDMRNSTLLSASTHDSSTASIYEFFTGTAVRIFHQFEARYIDIKGDGVFALFDKNQIFRSLAAAVTFKTFAFDVFLPKAKERCNLDIGFHMGIDQKTVLVKSVGIKDSEGRDSRQNEVWAGKPINMASKLASISPDNHLFVSDRYFRNLNSKELVTVSCGCPNGEKGSLWKEHDLSHDKRFDFDNAWVLCSNWCPEHGKTWCENILQLSSEE